ncbi:hypothetical protein ROJ8625_02285 [Roseivivax jejudonensis]|uniref:DUF4177 domain-containing protein n=1 Tax=Roseivivax jejudonensis TaxID=1529041 RepID=A0A1X6ZBV7_9RHOB|nr:DUF4177 domain-containing protein [Roseivivax jejudonensis]SLN47116.1 hypothetical protein ROJ8625_02285 [Roseivivax jejudonensis]
MATWEYKVVPAPVKGRKARGVKGAEARFALAVETLMNEMAAEGWEFRRAETLPSEERHGLTASVTVWRTMLVFRREAAAAPADDATAGDLPLLAAPADVTPTDDAEDRATSTADETERDEPEPERDDSGAGDDDPTEPAGRFESVRSRVEIGPGLSPTKPDAPEGWREDTAEGDADGGSPRAFSAIFATRRKTPTDET